MLQNKEEFKLNLQLFAEDDDKKDELVGAELKQMDLSGFVKKEDLSEFENRILQALKPKEELKKEEIKIDDKQKEDTPAWAKVLFDRLENIESSNRITKDEILNNKKEKLARDFGLDLLDLEDIKDEVSFKMFEKNINKIMKKKESDFEKSIPEMLKKKGKVISDYNGINKEQEKAINDKFINGMKFFRKK